MCVSAETLEVKELKKSSIIEVEQLNHCLQIILFGTNFILSFAL